MISPMKPENSVHPRQVPMGLLESVDIDVMDMGEMPLRMGGIKARCRWR